VPEADESIDGENIRNQTYPVFNRTFIPRLAVLSLSQFLQLPEVNPKRDESDLLPHRDACPDSRDQHHRDNGAQDGSSASGHRALPCPA
jgi:hypothetical protein